MVEPPQLLSAREHLALAEARYRSEDGLFHLEEGLALLEEVMAGSSQGYRSVAQKNSARPNLAEATRFISNCDFV